MLARTTCSLTFEVPTKRTRNELTLYVSVSAAGSAVCAGMAPRFHRSDCMDAMERMMLETAEAVGSAGK